MPIEHDLCGMEGNANPGWVAVRFREPAPHSMRAAVAGRVGLGSFSRRVEVPREKYTLFHVGPAADGASMTSAAAVKRTRAVLQRLAKASEVARYALLYSVRENHFMTGDRVIVGFDPARTDPRADLQAIGLQVLDMREGTYLLQLGERDDPDQVCRRIMQKATVRYAHPDYVMLGQHLPRDVTADAIRLAAVDENEAKCPEPTENDFVLDVVRARDAQQLLKGRCTAIKVAVLDLGVDEEHPDLAPVLGRRFDAVDNDFVQQPAPHDAHGTQCAGLAAGLPADASGVTGVASGCTILPARIFETVRDGPGFKLNATAWWIVSAIDWAWQSGAHVLSNSWTFVSCPAIVEALERARTRGRDGDGCVLVAGVGNSGGDVAFPALLPTVLGVGSTNACGRPKLVNSDYERWGSAMGPRVDLVTPGVRLYTADNTGSAGVDAGNHSRLSGTSASTAIAAGAAALVLCANGKLKEDAVRQILRDTARPVIGFPGDADGHNSLVGHGMLDVTAAVNEALARAQRSARPAVDTTNAEVVASVPVRRGTRRREKKVMAVR